MRKHRFEDNDDQVGEESGTGKDHVGGRPTGRPKNNLIVGSGKAHLLIGVGVGVLLLGSAGAYFLLQSGDASTPTPVAKESKPKDIAADAPRVAARKGDSLAAAPANPSPSPAGSTGKENAPVVVNEKLSPETVEKVKKATVYVRVTSADAQVSSGSGFFEQNSGLVMTNAHVLSMLDSAAPAPRKIELVLNCGEGREKEATVKATVVAVDRESDLAVLKPTLKGNPPTGLTVKPAKGLLLTQPVFVFGFPFGEKLGKNVTVSHTSISSLRTNNDGRIDQVQVNGGMHPGNSGGPVIDMDGNVVGVSVSGIRGTQINFAIPGERVDEMLAGRVTGIKIADPILKNAQWAVTVTAKVIDPLQRINTISLEHWIAAPGADLPASDNQPAATAQRATIPMAIDPATQIASGEIVVAPVAPGKALWVQPVRGGGASSYRWASSNRVLLGPPDTAPTVIAFKPTEGVTTLDFRAVTTLRGKVTGGDEEQVRSTMSATLKETVGKTDDEGLTPFTITFGNIDRDANIGSRNINTGRRFPGVYYVEPSWRLQYSLGRDGGLVNGKIELVGVKNDQSPDAYRDVGEEFMQLIEMLNVSVPTGELKQGIPWRATRRVPVDVLGAIQTGRVEVEYTYNGTQQFAGRKVAAIGVSGTLRGVNDRSAQLKGTATGVLLVDVESGLTRRGDLQLDVSLDLFLGNQTVHAQGVTEIKLTRRNNLAKRLSPTPQDLAKNPLLGQWTLVKQDGAADEPVKEKTIFVDINDSFIHIQANLGTANEGWRYWLEPGNKPGTLDIAPRLSSSAHPAIYEINGDELKICMNQRNDARPTAFVGDAKAGLSLFVLHRARIKEVTDVHILKGETPKLKKDETVYDLNLKLEADPLVAKMAAPPPENLEAKQEIRFAGHKKPIAGVFFTMDGAKVISSAFEDGIYVWDRAGNLMHRIEGKNATAAVSADGTKAISRGFTEASLIDLEAGKLIRAFEVFEPEGAVAISPTGRYAAIVGKDHHIRLYDASTGKLLRRFEGQTGRLNSLVFCLDGRTLVSASRQSIRCWNIETGDELFKGAPLTGSFAVVHPDGDKIATADHRGLYLWDIKTGKQIKSLPTVVGQESSSFSFSHDGRFFALNDIAYGTAVFETNRGELVHRVYTREVNAKTTGILSPRANSIVVIGPDNDFRAIGLSALKAPAAEPAIPTPADAVAIDPKSGYKLRLARELGEKSSFSGGAKFSPDGKRLFAQQALWDIDSGKQICKLTDAKPFGYAAFFDGGSKLITCGGHYPPNATVAVDSFFQIFNLKDGTLITRSPELNAAVRFIALAPNGKRFVAMTADRVVRVYETEGFKEIKAFEQEDFSSQIVISPDGKSFVVVVAPKMRLYDLINLREIRTFDQPKPAGVAFLPNGKLISSGGGLPASTGYTADKRIGCVRIWNVERGKIEREFGEDQSAVSGLSITADGKRALAVGRGGIVRVWDVPAEQELAAFNLQKSGLGDYVISPDGRFIYGHKRGEAPRLLELTK